MRAIAKFWVLILVFFGLSCRVGEADKPGPKFDHASWSLGVCNPSGLLGKSTLLADVNTDIIAVSETHLTSVSSSVLLQSLRSRSAYKYVVTGSPMCPRSTASEAGQYAGVAVVSKQPSRALCSAWPQDMYDTGRVQVVGSLIGNQWITGAVVYGYPQSKFHPRAAEKTAGLLAHVFDHMVLCAQGPRYMTGDWNFTPDQLSITQQLLDAGWQEVQTLELMRTNTPVRWTCKGKTQKDHLWLSPELVTAFKGLSFIDDQFPDHALMKAHFTTDPSHFVRYLWPTPQPVPWTSVPDLEEPVDFSAVDPTDQYAQLWKQREQLASQTLPQVWNPSMRGRGQRTKPLLRKGWPAPPKQGRSNDPQPAFYGYDVQHSRWIKQLRRLVNYTNWAKSHWATASTPAWTHGLLLWRSVLTAPGFGSGFSQWWLGRVCIGLSDPGFVPSSPPAPDLATQLCECFQCELRSFENRLANSKKAARVHAHEKNPNLIFRDTRRPAPEPVSSLLVKQKTMVAEVDMEDVAITLQKPCQFDDTKPVLVDDVPVPVIHATEDKVFLESVQGLQPGMSVTQSTPVGSLDAVFEAFHEQWQKRWCRHDQVPFSSWQQLIDFARAKMPQWQIPELPITPALLQAEVAFKKPTAAAGLDGVTRKDLQTAGPNMLLSLCNVYTRAAEDGVWPHQTITGKVASLAKVPHPEGTGDYRPITVFSLVYRCFSSLQARHMLSCADDWCHEDIHGNRKHHQTAHLWRTLVDQIQCAYDQKLCLSGLTADIEKAYNCLPRYPILAMALHVGTPFGLLQAWAGALAGMVRRFRVRDSFSSGFATSTGLAEGCALSCYGMLLLDDAMHRYVHAQCPQVRVLSFVDNWDFLTWDPAAATRQLDVLLDFASLVDLTVDRGKTFGWSTCPTVRSALRTTGLPVKHFAKDLGAHVAFSRQGTIQTLAQRLDSLDNFWTQLKASRASYRAKLRALRCVAWPRGLFGVASAPLGTSVWMRHRRRAVQSLAFDKPGVNPMLLLGLVEAQADPEWVGTLQAVAESRLLCPAEFWEVELFHTAIGLLSPPPSSPTSVLLGRIQRLGIQVHADGTWEDGVSRFHPGKVNFAELSLRLEWCWNRVVASAVAHRKDFQGLVHVDVVTTRRCLSLMPPDQQALMRLSLAGGLYTQDAHSHWNEGTGSCKWCGQPDSLEHRYFHCLATQAIREKEAPDLTRLRSQVPDALALRSWAIEPNTALCWRQKLASLPAEVPLLALDFVASRWNCVFTDGSCLWQSCPSVRVAAWSAVLAAPFSGHWTFAGHGVLCSGVLPGLTQTAFRSELYAVGVVLHHAAVGGFRVKIFSDCLGVVNKFNLLTRGRVRLKHNTGNADLWGWVLQSVERLGLDKVKIYKTPAHRLVASATTRYEAWLFWHNSTADLAARVANLDRGSDFWTFWHTHAEAVTAARVLHAQAWQLHLQVALLSVAEDKATTLDEVEVRGPKPTREFEKVFDISRWQGTLPLAFANEYGPGMAKRISLWWRARTAAGVGEVKWISFIHLYFDYQLTWGCVGPLQSKKTWLDVFLRPYVDGNKYPFWKRLKWFRRCMKQFWSQSHQQIGLAQCRCESEILQSHVQSASVKWDQATLAIAETWLAEHCKGPIARGTKLVQTLPVANALPGLGLQKETSLEVAQSAHGA